MSTPHRHQRRIERLEQQVEVQAAAQDGRCLQCGGVIIDSPLFGAAKEAARANDSNYLVELARLLAGRPVCECPSHADAAGIVNLGPFVGTICRYVAELNRREGA